MAPAWSRSASSSRRTLLDLLNAKEMVVVCGSGGTGKTTVAAALGAQAAVRLGGRVLVLTVDPARRLATALGFARLGQPGGEGARRRLHPGGHRPVAVSCGWRCWTPRPAGTN